MTTYSRLTREQRYTIEAMTRNGSEQKAIAEAIEVHPSTVIQRPSRFLDAIPTDLVEEWNIGSAR